MSALRTMTDRERFIETLTYGSPDKIPMMTMGPRKSTFEAWAKQGMDPERDWFGQLAEAVGIEYEYPQNPYVGLGVNFRMMPIFEEKVLEHRNGHYIVQDWMGNITEISDAFDVTYIRNAIDFVTRKWHKFPVENEADFESMKKRYNVDEPGRFPEDFEERCRIASERDWALGINIAGPFWQMREWCGFEPLCILFLDEPEFVRAMCEFWSDFVAQMLERILEHVTPDKIHINEDMAYKGASMISPAMTREFLQPAWTRWGRIVKQAGVPIYDMDSDGRVDDLIPIWIESGFDVCDPMEVAAGCDLPAYRQEFGQQIAYCGGIDKRKIAKGGQTLEDEFARLQPVIAGGGYIPGCDHGMPPDIKWETMHQFMRLWAEATGWL